MDGIQTQFPTCTHIMVVDFEATCGPGVSKTDAEIIEVGAVLVFNNDRFLYLNYPHSIVIFAQQS